MVDKEIPTKPTGNPTSTKEWIICLCDELAKVKGEKWYLENRYNLKSIVQHLESLDASKIKVKDINNVFVANNVEDCLDEIKKYIQDGKTIIANAITNKGVSTFPTASFQTMGSNISKIKTGYTTGDVVNKDKVEIVYKTSNDFEVSKIMSGGSKGANICDYFIDSSDNVFIHKRGGYGVSSSPGDGIHKFSLSNTKDECLVYNFINSNTDTYITDKFSECVYYVTIWYNQVRIIKMSKNGKQYMDYVPVLEGYSFNTVQYYSFIDDKYLYVPVKMGYKDIKYYIVCFDKKTLSYVSMFENPTPNNGVHMLMNNKGDYINYSIEDSIATIYTCSPSGMYVHCKSDDSGLSIWSMRDASPLSKYKYVVCTNGQITLYQINSQGITKQLLTTSDKSGNIQCLDTTHFYLFTESYFELFEVYGSTCNKLLHKNTGDISLGADTHPASCNYSGSIFIKNDSIVYMDNNITFYERSKIIDGYKIK